MNSSPAAVAAPKQLIVKLRTGEILNFAEEGGGGMSTDPTDPDYSAYEVAFYDADDNCTFVFQRDIETVADESGQEVVTFGNYYFEDHPHYEAITDARNAGRFADLDVELALIEDAMDKSEDVSAHTAEFDRKYNARLLKVVQQAREVA